jgi:hypothetical protein
LLGTVLLAILVVLKKLIGVVVKRVASSRALHFFVKLGAFEVYLDFLERLTLLELFGVLTGRTFDLFLLREFSED